MKKILLVAMVALVLTVGNGCILFLAGGAVAAGAGTVAYLNGELKDTESASLAAVETAAKAGLQDLQIAVIRDTRTAIDAKIYARTATDTKITITLTRQAPALTAIGIRVGTFGDEPLSRQILNKLKAHL
jgi:Protein of unknown function (DUF3568)